MYNTQSEIIRLEEGKRLSANYRYTFIEDGYFLQLIRKSRRFYERYCILCSPKTIACINC